MNRQQYLEAFRHEIGGMVLDAATVELRGAALSLFLRHAMAKIDAILTKQYEALAPPAPPLPVTPTNGTSGNGHPARRAPA